MEQISLDDQRHEAAQGAIDAMHNFWKTQPMIGAVQWLEDSDGNILIFTRGEHSFEIRNAVMGVTEPLSVNQTEAFEISGKESNEQ